MNIARLGTKSNVLKALIIVPLIWFAIMYVLSVKQEEASRYRITETKQRATVTLITNAVKSTENNNKERIEKKEIHAITSTSKQNGRQLEREDEPVNVIALPSIETKRDVENGDGEGDASASESKKSKRDLVNEDGKGKPITIPSKVSQIVAEREDKVGDGIASDSDESKQDSENKNSQDDDIPSLSKDNKSYYETDEIEMDGANGAVLAPPLSSEGLGEMGRPVVLSNLTKEQQMLVDEGWSKNAFNQYVSDLVSLHRKLPDFRDPQCLNMEYGNILPVTTVIICFHNEAWSALLRTVHSILDRTPLHLIKEIILVDDFSNMPHLAEPLKTYLSHLSPPGKVRVIRTTKREGLIRARLFGASAATSEVITFLDSHCECSHGWLEPMLDRIANNKTAIVCPVIIAVDKNSLEYRQDSSHTQVGGFNWNLDFRWMPVPDREIKRRKHNWEPVRSPTMAGGLFSINKEFFEKLGTYDNGFEIWGKENLELSFKAWMCGGTLETLPCSHVGHIFRERSPYKWLTGVDVIKKNAVRLAEVWMDDYAKIYYDRINNKLGDFGDVSGRKWLREKLKCKSFKWYLENIFPELYIPTNAIATGQVMSLGPGGETCLESPGTRKEWNKPVNLTPCKGNNRWQIWMLSKEGEFRRDEMCLDYDGNDVVTIDCHMKKGNQHWIYDHEKHQVRHRRGECLEISEDKKKLQMRDCISEKKRQHWLFQNYDPSKIKSRTA